MKLCLLASLCLLAISAARADLFVSSFSQNSVRRYDENGAFVSTFIAAGSGGLDVPWRGIFLADGNYYVASANNDRILRYDGQTGAFIDVFIQNGAKGLPAGTLDYPVDMTIGPDGALYVSSQQTNTILRFDATSGAFLNTFVTSGLDSPSGIGFLNGDLFVASRFSRYVHRYDSTGAFEMEIGAGVLNGTLYGLTFGPDGNLYVAIGGSASVEKFDPTTGASLGNFVSTLSGGLYIPIGIEFGADHQLYAASFNTDEVKRYDGGTGAYVSDFVTAGNGGLDQPTFITFAVPEPSSSVLCTGAVLLLGLRRPARLG